MRIILFILTSSFVSAVPKLTVTWEKNWLYIHGDHLPGVMRVHYLEAYCRANSQTTDWSKHTVVGHETKLVSAARDGSKIELLCVLSDGVTVKHTITTTDDEVDFRLTAHNPSDKRSEAHWAQPCVRVGVFTGTGAKKTSNKYAYVEKSFIFLDGKQAMMPTRDWAMEARYIPGQVWTAPGVARADVNPRPLHKDVPDNGLIGCYSLDEKMLFATAWEPYQELFQGVGRCLHSDFRLGGLKPDQTLRIKGKIYLVENNLKALLIRYRKDFPDHLKKHRN
ncbi:MAG: hypothetical protein HOK49_00085 [Opitutae bacterium]|nr:hypothetical protein [Opitutae bacterium]MBT6460916.1 hypothetical protein [Opitutae bacterium]